jgi:hypothetical protein
MPFAGPSEFTQTFWLRALPTQRLCEERTSGLLSGIVLAAVGDVVFVKDGRKRQCFSPKEFAIVAAA